MTTITEEIIRKRAEHNAGQIGSLEEISLHQQDINKIDNIQKWCKDLKILLLQANIISKIENLSKLKKLQYLNLAINNIEHIENLDGCESLHKLDLTLNFIGDLTSVESLKGNYNLRELYLSGNPCWKFEGYRDYIIATLPQLQILDGISISPTDQVLSKQNYETTRLEIIKQQNEYLEKQKLRKQNIETNKLTNEDSNDAEPKESCWKQISENSPETRLAMAEHNRKTVRDRVIDLSISKPERKIKFFKADGSPLNINEAKIPFTFQDFEEKLVLTVNVYKHLDTNLLDVDVQPTFVRILVKNKVLQLVLPEEVHPDKCTAQRSLTSRKLVITMPKVLIKY